MYIYIYNVNNTWPLTWISKITYINMLLQKKCSWSFSWNIWEQYTLMSHPWSWKKEEYSEISPSTDGLSARTSANRSPECGIHKAQKRPQGMLYSGWFQKRGIEMNPTWSYFTIPLPTEAPFHAISTSYVLSAQLQLLMPPVPGFVPLPLV